MRPRRIHVFGVGAAKTGTKSIASIFGGAYRTQHEACSAETIRLIQKVEAGKLNREQVVDALRKRDRKLRLEVEVSHLLVHFAPLLVELFPEAKFIFTVRDPRSWLRSVINQNINNGIPTDLPDEDPRSPWREYGVIKYGEQPGGPYPLQEWPLARFADHGVYSISGYLSNWVWHNRTVLEGIPSERLLSIRTRDISHSIGRIAAFVGVSAEALQAEKSHTHKTPKKNGVLEKIDESYIRSKIDKHCASTIRLIEEKTSLRFS